MGCEMVEVETLSQLYMCNMNKRKAQNAARQDNLSKFCKSYLSFQNSKFLTKQMQLSI